MPTKTSVDKAENMKKERQGNGRQWLEKKKGRLIDAVILSVSLLFLFGTAALMTGLKIDSYESYACLLGNGVVTIEAELAFEKTPEAAYIIIGEEYSRVQIKKLETEGENTRVYLAEPLDFTAEAGTIELIMGKETILERFLKYL